LPNIPIGRLITVAGGETGATYAELLRQFTARQIPVEYVQNGSLRSLAADLKLLLWQPLAATQAAADGHEHDELNDRSLVVQLIHQDVRFLFSGDLEAAGEDALLSTPGFEATTTVLKVPHHGSQTSSTPAFLSQLQPQEAIVSVGERNRFRHPSQTVLERYELAGARLWRTDQQGAVCVCSQGQTYQVWAARSDRD